MANCNSTSSLYDIDEHVLWPDGATFHHLIIYISSGLCSIAVLLSLKSIWSHSLGYTRPFEQRHIIRILFMVPVYSLVSLFSIVFYRHAVYFELVSDTYSAIAIASFFALMSHYVRPNLHEQKEYFRSIDPKPWMNSWPLLPINIFKKCCGGERGPWRRPRSGLTWYNIIYCGAYQYCLVRFSMSIIAVVTQNLDRYCELSNSPQFAHIWVLVLDAVSSSIAMYCLESMYEQLKQDLEGQHIKFKLYCVKMVFSLSLYQNLIMSLLTSSWLPAKIQDNMAPSAKLNAFDIKIGIPYFLLSFELVIIAILHLYAFPSKAYQIEPSMSLPGLDFNGVPLFDGARHGGLLGFKAMAQAINPWDFVKSIGRSIRWLFSGRRTRKHDPSYKVNLPDFELEPYAEDQRMHKSSGYIPGTRHLRRANFELVDEGRGLITVAGLDPYTGYVPSVGDSSPGRPRDFYDAAERRNQQQSFFNHGDQWEGDLANARGYI